MNKNSINPNSISGGGANTPCDAKFCEKCPCSHNNNTALIKQISLFDTALVMTNTINEYFTPILLGLNVKKKHS